MAFLHFFDELDFDANGNVCATKDADLNKARSNFLYLICKYNQEFLAEKEIAIPSFFKENLSSILADVESGKKSFDKAKKEVFAQCLPVVQACMGSTDKAMILSLNEFVSFSDKALSKKFENDLHKNYVQTVISGKLFDEIERAKEQFATTHDKKSKSELFKKMIKFNRLASSIGNVSEQPESVAL